MTMLLNWLTQSSHWLSSAQIGLDLALITVLVVAFWKRPQNHAAARELADHLGRIIQDSQEIARQFESNLQERRTIIQELLVRLDHRLTEADQLCRKLEAAKKGPQAPAINNSGKPPGPSQHDEILRLAGKGLDAAAIAQHLRRPLGEVELVLSLRRLAPSR